MSDTNLFLKFKTLGMGSWYDQQKKVNQSLQNMTKDANRTADGFNKANRAFSGFNQVIGVAKIYALATAFSKSVQSAMNMIETQNLYSVAVGDNIEKTNQFVEALNTAFGFDTTNIQSAVGTFSLLARSMGMTSDTANVLSTNTTKLAYDLSSLTNVPIQQVMQDLRSGLVGQSETMYKYGVDVTEASLKQEAMIQGISKSVRNMSQGEKMALRYSVMIRQTALAHGDFARTINTPANQLKILSERFITLGRSIGTIFIPMLTTLLPYLNALASFLIYCADAIAKFFGYIPTTPSKVANTFSGIEDGASDATDAVNKMAKAIKNATLPLDELNVLQQESASGAGGTGDGATVGAVDWDLTGYNNGMDQVKSKSDEIAKSMMDAFNMAITSINWKPALYALGDLERAFIRLGGLLGDTFGRFYDNFLMPIGIWFGETVIPDILNGITFAVETLSLGLLKIQDINYDPLVISIKNLWEGFKVFAEPIGQGLRLFFVDVLVPLGKWAIESAIPAVFDVISGVFRVLGETLDALLPSGKELLDNVLTPLASFVADAFIQTLRDVAGGLNNVSDWIKNNKDTVVDITTIIGEFFLAWKVAEILAFIQTAGGVVGALKAISGQMVITTLQTIATKIETLALATTYAKNLVMSCLDAVGGLAKLAWQFIATNAEQALYKLGMIATTIATTAYNAIITIATTLTTAFGAVMTFITGPIGLVILAVTALGACAYVLYTKWDEISPKISAVFKGIGNYCIGILNNIVLGFEKMTNFIIEGLNKLILAYNELKSALGIEGWTPQIKPVKFNLIPTFASGGFPEMGSMFIAGEAGAELVGNIGGKTAVVNNQQIVDAVSQGVAKAVSDSLGSQSGNAQVIENVVNLDGEVIYKNQQRITRDRGYNFGMGVFAR